MGQIIILGSSNAVAAEGHENTHLAILQGNQTLLVDAVGSPIVRLRQAGIEPISLTGLIVTHFHPDHISGVPILLMDLWLLGRKDPLPVFGLTHTIDRLEKMMDLYEWQRWPGFFPVQFHRLAEEDRTIVIDNPELKIFASPVKHLLPTIGLRVEFPSCGCAAAYSCDTEPCQATVGLAEGADVLIHEATGASVGHSSAAQAAQIARRAEVSRLYLIHYNPLQDGLVAQARQEFPGPVTLAEDLMRIDLN